MSSDIIIVFLILSIIARALIRIFHEDKSESEENYDSDMDYADDTDNDDLAGNQLRILEEAKHLYDSALFFMEQKNFKQAKRLLKKSISAYEKSIGLNDYYATSALYNLAWCYFTEAKFRKAEAIYKKILLLFYEFDDVTSMMFLHVYTNLAGLYFEQNLRFKTEIYIYRIKELVDKELEKENYEVLPIMNNIAYFYRKWGRIDEAENIERRINKIMGTSLIEIINH